MANVKSAPRKNRPITPAELDKYVEAVAAGLTYTDAAKHVGRSAYGMRKVRERDPEFNARVSEAWQEGADSLIAEAARRGRDGWKEPIYQKGELVGWIHKYDSNLLMFSIKGRRPEFKENPKIDLNQTNVALSFEDRSASITAMWKVLADAGVDAKEIAGSPGTIDGRAVVVGELSAVEGAVAEPSDV